MTKRPAILNLTPQAQARVQQVAQDHGNAAVLLGVKSRGCSGLSYNLTTVAHDALPANAEKIVCGGVTLAIAPESLLYLLGTTIDYEDTGLRAGFVFRNPNETGRCGCGESFTVADKN